MTSGNREDEIIAELLPERDGYYWDLGAGDGTTLSNTWLFAQRGWKGLAVEGNFENMPALIKTYRDKPNVTIMNAVVSVQGEIRPFWIPIVPNCSHNATISEALYRRGHERTGSDKIFVKTISVRVLALAFGEGVDYVSIDLDGFSLEILMACPFTEMQTKVVCVEWLPAEVLGTDERPPMIAYMEELGFRLHREAPENLIFVKGRV